MSQPRLACNLSGEIQFDPTISPVNTFDHDYYFELPHEEGVECSNQIRGDLLRTMALHGLLRVRTELYALLVITFFTPHPVQVNR